MEGRQGINDHALERLLERLPLTADRGPMLETLKRAQAKYRHRAVAVILGRLPTEQVMEHVDTSNGSMRVSEGDTIIAILREGRATTVMLRRTQPCSKCLAVRGGYRCPHRQELSPFALYVDQVVTRV